MILAHWASHAQHPTWCDAGLPCLYILQGTYEEASSSYDAAHAALGVVSNSSSGAGSGSSSSLQADPSAGVSARFQHEIAADIALGAAQVCALRFARALLLICLQQQHAGLLSEWFTAGWYPPVV